jgi:hypothetical protein
LAEQPVQILLQKWEELIEVQENLLRFLTAYEEEIKWGHEVPVQCAKTGVSIAAVAGAVLLFL